MDVGKGRWRLFPVYEAAERPQLAVLRHPANGESDLREAPWSADGPPETSPARDAVLMQPRRTCAASSVSGRVFEHFLTSTVVLVGYGITWTANPIPGRTSRAWL